MVNIIKKFNEVPTWEKVVIVTLVVVPIPFVVETYLGVRTIYKHVKNNTEK